MPKEFFALLFAAALASAVAALVLYSSAGIKKIVCRTFVVLCYLSPWLWGSDTLKKMWQMDLSNREAFLAAWFIAFATSLVGVTAFASRFGV